MLSSCTKRSVIAGVVTGALLAFSASSAFAQSELINPVPAGLPLEHMQAASTGCLDCHTKTDAPSMHKNPAVQIGCTDCHGGDANIRTNGITKEDPHYDEIKKLAHVLPKHPENFPTSRNPARGYTNILKESPEFVKFINPGDLRVAAETCGGCHAKIVRAAQKSLMTTSAMLWEGASYNNNILPYKRAVLGESYDKNGEPQNILADRTLTEEEKRKGMIEKLVPMPQWEVTKPGDVFRVFERGGINIKSQFPEIGNPNPYEDPGKPDIRQSNRGPGTGLRVSIPVLNIHKTRLNDPHLSLMGTNDHPGDFRSSGCTSCHTIYANDRDPKHSGPYAAFGHEGKSQTVDPTIPKDEEGHPLYHEFTRSIPSSQCMVCHMHQPNMFVNSYYGYTMWDYESDAPSMWPKEEKHPTIEETFKSLDANPEEAAVRGLWSDETFLRKVSELNSGLKDTQFADYHGHGWNFRAIFKRDRKGNLLDANDKVVSAEDTAKFKKAVHMADIHMDKGMQCADCHFGQDSHGDGNMYTEVAQSVEVQCRDCHGTAREYATLKTSGPAAPPGGNDLSTMRVPDGRLRFEWVNGALYQRSNMDPTVEWRVKQTQDTVNPASADYNPRSAAAKLTKHLTDRDASGFPRVALDDLKSHPQLEKALAHGDEEVACFACHSSWVTSCAGCHLPIQANWKQKSKHYDGKETRNWASYNPQVARDEMFQLGKHGPAKAHRIVPVRSSSALILSSTDINRQRIYTQQPPVSAAGFSSQAFAPHFPHTVRAKETKQCDDCHISEKNDNNAWMTQLLLLGTQFVNFMGYHAYVGTGDGGFEAVQVTEWDEPQAVIGSYLQKYAYPERYAKHEAHKAELETSHHHGSEGGAINTVQLRGEYLYTTAGRGGFRVYDVQAVGNKGFSERLVTSPVSPLGQDTHVSTTDATSFAIPTNMTIAPFRIPLAENEEQPMHPIYHYAVIADRVEGLILVNVDTLSDGEPRNNYLRRDLTWNENNVLSGARFVTLAGSNAIFGTDQSMVVVSLDDPMHPVLKATLPFRNVTSVAVQFRYAFVTDADGFHVVDFTDPFAPRRVEGADIALADARSVYLARTYAYVSGGHDGLVIIDIERPEQPKEYMRYTDDGKINDLYDVKIATTNASLFAYLADGANGLKVVQLTDPDRVPEFYGFSPAVKPALIAWKKTSGPAMSISKALDRDRAVDETGNQVSIFGRLGSRPFNLEEMRKMYLRPNGKLYTVPGRP